MTETTDVRDSQEVRHSDSEVRRVNNPDGLLYAYREDGEHVVVSRGNEPRTRWVDRVPAERTAVVAGEQLWTIPDNWEHEASINGNGNRSYGVYHIPETDVDVLVSNPDNCHLVDKWFSVKRVGEFAAEYDDSIDTEALQDLADSAPSIDAIDDATADALETLAARADRFEQELADDVNRYALDAIKENSLEDAPISLEWTVDPWGDTYPMDTILDAILDVDDDTLDNVLTELDAENVYPHYPKVRVDVTDDVDLPDEYHIRALTQAGCSASEALDYLMVEIRGWSQSDWADERGIGQGSVSQNVNGAEIELKA